MTSRPGGRPTQDGDDNGIQRGRPCDSCRRRKSKCVTESGDSICMLCKFHNHRCTYNEAPQPRKRSLYSSSLTATDDVSLPATSKRRRTILFKPGTGVEEYDTLPGPSLLKHTLGLQNKHHSEYVAPNTVPDVYGDIDGRSEDHGTAQQTIRFVHPRHAFRIIPDSQTEGCAKEESAADDIEATAQPHGPDMVQLYFRIVHPSFPILHKDVFLEKYARSHREFSPPLLAAVYLLASIYWSYDEKLSASRRIDTGALQKLAFDALQNTMGRPKLSTIQAGLLLSQWRKAITDASNEKRDGLTAQLVHMSYGLGLHLDCSQWDIPDWEIGLRRRIGWALYMQDKWIALLEGHPSLISHDAWDVAELSEYDFPENVEDDQEGSSEVQRGRLVFMYMAHLSVILDNVLRTLFSAKSRKVLSAAPDQLGALLQTIKPLQIQLKDWSLTLPESLKMDTAASMKLSSIGYLRLAYLTAEVCVHKSLLRTLAMTANPDTILSQVCRGAAKERFTNAADFIGRLQAQHLHSFWYFTSARCCALIHSIGQALASSAQSEDEQAMYARKLKEFKWALKVNSEAGASFMKEALMLIGQSVRIVHLAPDTGSLTMRSPASIGQWMKEGEGSMSAQQEQPSPLCYFQQQHLDYRDGSNGDLQHYDDYAMQQTDFTDLDTMFGGLASEFDGPRLRAEMGMNS